MTKKYTKEYFQECGRKGGESRSEKKIIASRANGKKHVAEAYGKKCFKDGRRLK